MRLFKCIKLLATPLLSLSIFTGAFAQKIPNKQVISVRAPENVKIDGKPTEWGDQLQAFNTATEIFYTIANDDENLYLIVQSKDQNIMRRIINGGITLAIQKTDKKSDNGAARIKFPYFEKGKSVSVELYQNFENGPRKDPNGHIADSLKEVNNKRLRSNVKWIYTSGLFGKDSVISIYNNLGIEAANGFDNKKNDKVYTSELAVSLNLLGLSAKNASKFYYHIIVNGDPNKYSLTASFGTLKGTNKDGTAMNQAQLDALGESLKLSAAMSSTTTDFRGEYTLTKKP